jgi:hypothetical protein
MTTNAILAADNKAHAICWGVVDCGRQTWYFEERPRRVREVRLLFEVIGERRYSLETRYNFSFWPTAKLHQHLTSWYGRPLTRAEREGFDLEILVGRPALLQMSWSSEHRTVRDIRPGTAHAMPEHRPLFLSLEPGRFDPEAYHRLPERLRDRIMASPTYHALCTGESGEEFPAEFVREATMAEILDHDEVPW